MIMRWSAVLAALLLVTAGCLGSSDDDGVPSADGDDEDTGPQTTWETVTRSGTVSGAGTPAGSVSQGGGNMATWTVPQDTRIMYLNLTAEGGELSMQYGPDCNTEDTVECEYQTTTEDGEAREIVEDPAADGWEAYLFIENDAGEVDWELTATMGAVDG
jgi:hypothetical protein